jgi:uncharacterized protein YndB with AHSA1/START domain
MTMPENTENLPADRTIRSSRVFGASRGRLWTLFGNPDLLARWWGPAGFINEFHEFDFRPGGTWRFTMRGLDGAEYPMRKVFVEVAEPERIVLDHIDPVHGFRMFMTFREAPEGTVLDWIMVFDFTDEAAKVRPFIGPANEQNFDRLNALLKQSTMGGQP